MTLTLKAAGELPAVKAPESVGTDFLGKPRPAEGAAPGPVQALAEQFAQRAEALDAGRGVVRARRLEATSWRQRARQRELVEADQGQEDGQ